MSAAAPWSVKGIEPRAREIAKDLARRSGMTLGEWLNTMIMEDGDDDDGVVPLSRRPHAADSYERRGRNRRVDDAYGSGEEPWHRLTASIDAIAARLEGAERRSTLAIQGVDQAVEGLVRRLENQDHSGKAHGRRIDDIAEELREGHKRLRKFEQEVGPRTAETFGKVETALGGLAGRLYDIEERQRSGVNELRQRMDAVEKTAGPGVGADLLAQVGQRLDQAQGRTTEALRGLERSFASLDQRLRVAEGRVEPEGVREAARFEKLAETLSRSVEANRAEMMRRLDTAETEGRMDRIERAVLAIGDQVRSSEERSAKAVEAMGREVLNIAQNLNGRVGKIEADAPKHLAELGDVLGRKIEADISRAAQLLELGLEQRMVATDDRHALALEKLGGEITRISDRLSERIAQSERRSAQALEDIGRRLVDSSGRIEQHYDRASGELAERMRLSEERTATLIAEARESMGRRAEPASPALPVAAPNAAPNAASDAAIAATVEAVPDWRATVFTETAFSDAPFSAEPFQGQAFDDDPDFDAQQAWSADLAPPDPQPSQFAGDVAAMDPEILSADAIFDAVMRGPRAQLGTMSTTLPFGSRPVEASQSNDYDPVDAAAPAPNSTPTPTPTPTLVPVTAPGGFGQAFGGADVSDALAATAPDAFGPDDFDGETDFVDVRALRAAAAQGRASSTRQAIDAARAAMTPPVEDEAPRSGFGLKRGGKSRLQERLDKQAKGSDTVRKALGASGVAVALTLGGAYAFSELTDAGWVLPNFSAPAEAQPIAALAVTPTVGASADTGRGAELYARAVALLDTDDASAIDALTAAADVGYAPAQLHLAGLYQQGDKGVDVDLGQARALARRAAAGGDARGMHAYGMYLFDGVGGPQNRVEALSWLEKAAGRGLVDSQFNVAKLYETGDRGISADPAQAYKWYMIASRAGDSDAAAAVDRLRGELSSAARGKARAEADRFTVEPLA